MIVLAHGGIPCELHNPQTVSLVVAAITFVTMAAGSAWAWLRIKARLRVASWRKK